MKIGLAQYKFINNNIEFNLSQIEKALSIYAGKLDLICFGESFLQGFDSLSWDYEIDKEIAVTQDSNEIKRICRWSKEYDVAILIGYMEHDDDAIYSSCAFINDGCVEENYRRMSVGWKEFSKTDFHYQEGNELVSFNFIGHNFSIALCGDLWDVDWEKFKTDATILWPVYVNFGLDEWVEMEKEYAEQAEKIANRILMVNSLSDEPVSHGGTFDFKSGTIADKIPYDKEDVLIIGL